MTRQVLRTGAAVTAADVFTGQRRLAELAAECAPVWQQIDTLLVPTVPTTFTVAEVAADPVTRNAFLGYYTHFVNLLDLAGVAVPNGFTPAGLPHGVTFLAPAGGDALLAAVAERFQQEAGLPAGATERPLLRTPARRSAPVPEVRDRMVLLAVAGTHRTGQPLHPRLAALGSAVVGTVHTAPTYRLYALPDDGLGPARPGLVRAAGEIDAGAGGSGGIGSGGIGSGVGGSDGIGSGVGGSDGIGSGAGGSDGIGSGAGGAGGIGSGAGGAGAGGAVEVELHRIPVARLGELLTEIPPPLGLGTVALADGSEVLGFLCEPYATVTALDITGYGSWPAYLAAVGSDPAGSAA